MGFDINDTPIRKTVDCMKACLRGERKIDDYWEKTHDWPLFTQLMLSTWVKLFDPCYDLSLDFAGRWAEIIEKSFAKGRYDHDDYLEAYISHFGKKPRGAREIDFVDFYHLSLLQGTLTRRTECLMMDYVMTKQDGIFYIYRKPLNLLPTVFASKESSHYLGALELLAGYECTREKYRFAVEWLNENKDEQGQWDFGARANDNTYFPLSNSWRKTEDRKSDCTQRVTAILRRLDM